MQKSELVDPTATNSVGFLYVLRTFVQGRFQGAKDRGATAVEYGLLVGLIAVVIIGSVGLLGTKLDGLFTLIETTLP